VLPAVVSFAEAVDLARDARRRSLRSITVVVDAEGRRGRMRGFAPAWRDVAGVGGPIVGRYADEDGVIERLCLRLEVVDVLAANDAAEIVRLSDPETPSRARARRMTTAR